jgi:hypothetical protein
MLLVLSLIFNLLGAANAQASPCLDQITLRYLSIPLQDQNDAETLVHRLAYEFRACRDPHGIFAEVYAATLNSISKRLNENRFYDPTLIRKMMVFHTNLYREALERELTGKNSLNPKSWQTAFKAIRSQAYKPGTILVLSMNAHIAYDLAKTLIELEIPLQDPWVRADYQMITRILKASMNDLWDAFRVYDHNPLIIPKTAELGVMIRWAAWMREEAWQDAFECQFQLKDSCLKSIDASSGSLSRIYRSLDPILH